MVWSYRYPALVMEREKAMELGRFTVLKSDKPCHLVVLRPFHVHGRAFLVSLKSSALRERLAYRLWSSSSRPQHTAKTNDASSPAKETTTTTTTICDSRVRGTLEEPAKVNQAARSSNHFLTRITVPSCSRRIHEQKKKKKKKKIILPEKKKKKKKTSNQISK